MKIFRKVKRVMRSKATLEGAGVHLQRAFGFGDVPLFDPFLMLDDFRGDTPERYLKGFPWHPHRGIETITYMIAGQVAHGDSMGNRGVIAAGDVQWMTAGNGIIHQEMPSGDPDGVMGGFQLWANLPASHKMIDPRYQEIPSAAIPEIEVDGGTRVRVLCGTVGGTRGPVQDIVIDPQYLDIRVPAESVFEHPTPPGHTVFAYVFEGQGDFGTAAATDGRVLADNRSLVLYADGERLRVSTAATPVRFLLVAGRPIGEPIAWQGPIVMNTQEELATAFRQYRDGTFIRHNQR